MNTNVQRAREIAFGIDLGHLWIDSELEEEVAGLLHTLSDTIEAQRASTTSAQLALEYYSEPQLYFVPVAAPEPILDGGLRARTALWLMRGKRQREQWNTTLEG
jgi:hypothetical protein